MRKEEDIKKVSFWSIDSPRIFENGEVMDYMTVAISTQDAVNVVDRENLQLIYQEQKLNQQVFIDESQARRLGELYGEVQLVIRFQERHVLRDDVQIRAHLHDRVGSFQRPVRERGRERRVALGRI